MRKTNARPWNNERGSTLILVVLLTLILSATAIVALRDVARSARGSAVFRTRAQAQLTSDAADRLFADWIGNMADTIIDGIRKSNYGEEGGVQDSFAGGDAPTGMSISDRRLGMAILGGEVEFDMRELALDGDGDGKGDLFENNGDPDESGLFQTAAGDQTFERRRKVKWRVKIRDLSDGFPAIGYSEGFCFKKALIASEAQVGVVDPDWSRSNNVAQARHGIDAMIGPVPCGYN